MSVNVGDRVRVERDETRYPSKGTWPQFRGLIGTVVEVNTDQRRHLTEYGVSFGSVTPRPDRAGTFNWDASSVAWFKLYEMRRVGSQGHLGRTRGTPRSDDTAVASLPPSRPAETVRPLPVGAVSVELGTNCTPSQHL